MDPLVAFRGLERPMHFTPARRLYRINRVFGVVYRGRRAMKALERANRRLYDVIKYVTLGGLLAAFLVWA